MQEPVADRATGHHLDGQERGSTRSLGLRWIWLLPYALVLGGCGLWPVRQDRLVSMTFVPDTSGQYVAEDTAAVYRQPGLAVKVRYLATQALNAEYPEQSAGRVDLNPFTFGTRIDNNLGYVPDRFTVFQVEVDNLGLPRVELDPRQARLITDRGDRLEPWGIHKGDATQTFEIYYRSRRGAGGNEEEWYRQRMAIVERAVSTRNPLFKGQNQRGKVVFDPLAPEVRQVRLQLREFVTAFDAHDTPIKKIDLEFPFTVNNSIRPASAKVPAEPAKGGP